MASNNTQNQGRRGYKDGIPAVMFRHYGEEAPKVWKQRQRAAARAANTRKAKPTVHASAPVADVATGRNLVISQDEPIPGVQVTVNNYQDAIAALTGMGKFDKVFIGANLGDRSGVDIVEWLSENPEYMPYFAENISGPGNAFDDLDVSLKALYQFNPAEGQYAHPRFLIEQAKGGTPAPSGKRKSK